VAGHPADIDELSQLLMAPEGSHLEFKEAKQSFDSEKLTRYCVALMNERGGSIIFGVTDRLPRRVVGTAAFGNLNEHQRNLGQRLGCRVEMEAFAHPDGRVVVVTVPSRPIGSPVEYEGAYWMREGASLVPMDSQRIRRILDEAQSDFSAMTCAAATTQDLDVAAIARLRELVGTRMKGVGAVTQTEDHLLADLGLIQDERLTYAALILLGGERGIKRHLPLAEIIFEYRGRDGQIGHDERREFKEGLLVVLEPLWDLVNKRNAMQPLHIGLFREEIPMFHERSVREAILNAMCHRDYRNQSSVFVRQTPTTLEVISPGGFPLGVTAETVLWKQSPRNRLLADVLLKCGLVERSGQGADLMFDAAIRQGKSLPDYEASDDWAVVLRLDGTIKDPAFIEYLQKLGRSNNTLFGVMDLLVLNAVHRGDELIPEMKQYVPKLLESGAIEKSGHGRGVRYMLAEKFYRQKGMRGTYTREKGLDRKTNQALLMAHIERFGDEGSPLRDLLDVLRTVPRTTVQGFLRELRQEGRIALQGTTSAARYFPASPVEVAEGADEHE